MAEFAELMKQARRMCGSISCDNCILPRGSDEMGRRAPGTPGTALPDVA